MGRMGMHTAEVKVVFETAAAVLHLGNAEFGPPVDDGGTAAGGGGVGEGGAALTAGRASLEAAAGLLSIPGGASTLVAAMSAQHLTIRGEAVERRLSPEQASDARDALSKAVDAHLFESH